MEMEFVRSHGRVFTLARNPSIVAVEPRDPRVLCVNILGVLVVRKPTLGSRLPSLNDVIDYVGP
jgi:hypothetical protein